MDKGYLKVCNFDDIEEGAVKLLDFMDEKIMLVRENDELFALSGYCTHDGGLIDSDKVIGGEVECPRHGARFNVRNGEATVMPAVVGLETLRVKVVDGEVFIGLDE